MKQNSGTRIYRTPWVRTFVPVRNSSQNRKESTIKTESQVSLIIYYTIQYSIQNKMTMFSHQFRLSLLVFVENWWCLFPHLKQSIWPDTAAMDWVLSADNFPCCQHHWNRNRYMLAYHSHHTHIHNGAVMKLNLMTIQMSSSLPSFQEIDELYIHVPIQTYNISSYKPDL